MLFNSHEHWRRLQLWGTGTGALHVPSQFPTIYIFSSFLWNCTKSDSDSVRLTYLSKHFTARQQLLQFSGEYMNIFRVIKIMRHAIFN